VKRLQALPSLRECGDAYSRRVIRTVFPGTAIVRQGEPADAFYIVARGST
jgi:hypothetical protein